MHIATVLIADDDASFRRVIEYQLREAGYKVSCAEDGKFNILINAIQAQPQGGKVLIRVFRESEELVISIQDSGPGISPEHLDRIFDPFFTTKREGTGLGLSISYQLVSSNGGRIRVTSPPGEGACFIVSFPIVGFSPAG